MSFRSRQPIPPTRHRSSSATRSTTSSNPSTYSRPRSVGLFSSNPSSNNLFTSFSSGYSSPYNNNYTSYSSNYKSPYFTNGYKGSSSGYASLTIPAKALANINLIPNNYSREYDSTNRSRSVSRQGSFNRDRSVSKSRSPSVVSGMGSRSVSLTSLNSEGYFVRIRLFVVFSNSLNFNLLSSKFVILDDNLFCLKSYI